TAAERRKLEEKRRLTQAERKELERVRKKLEEKRRLTEAERHKLDRVRGELKEERRLADAERRELKKNLKLTAAERRRLEEKQRLAVAERRELKEKQRLTDAERSKLEQKQRLADAERKELESERRTAEKSRRALSTKEQQLATRWQEVDDKHASIEKQRQRLNEMQQRIDKAQATIEQDRQRLLDAQRRVENEQEKSSRKSETSREATQREKERLHAERDQLKQSRRSIEKAQRELKEERRRLARAREKFQHAEADHKALQRQRRVLDRERKGLAKKRRELAKLEAKLQRRKAAIRKRERNQRGHTPSALAAPPANPVVVANYVTPVPSAVAANRGPARLTGITRRGTGKAAGVLLMLDRTPIYEAQRIADPPRLVIDLADTMRALERVTYGVKTPFIRQVRLGDHGSVLRVVLDLTTLSAPHDIIQTAEGLLVTIEPPGLTEVATAEPETAAPTAGNGTRLKDVRFKGSGDVAQVILDLEGTVNARVDDRSKKAWVLELRGATIPKTLERSLDTTAYGTVVRLISTYQASTNPPIVNVVANLAGEASHDLSRKNGSITWEIRGRPSTTLVATAATPQTAGFTAEAAVLARSTPRQSRSKKKRISIDLKDADIVNVIRLLAEVSGQNIITSDDVTGKITLKLRNVPWDQALDTILKTKGYDKVRHHNILRIAPAEKIRQEKEQELARKKAQEQVEDTLIKMITVNYADASEVIGQLKPLLSGRGTVQVDSRTNTIIIEDVKSNIGRIVELTKRLDKQTPQVLIEARIVEASSNNLEQLGIQWGGLAQATAATGNPTGLMFPGDFTVSGHGPAPTNYAVNVPAAVGAGGGGLAFAFGSAGGSQILNLRLAALEEEGKGRIISSPRITTLDNRTARISQGIDIPVTVVSAAGANTRFIPANLELEVTPHVTNDGSVLMKILTSKNEPDFANTGAQGDPTIMKKMAQTEVLVRDGDTTVIGGIYTRTTSEVYAKVPIFGDIPIIGWLFKNRRIEDNRAELLVFITPRIINRQESLLQGASLPGSPGAIEQ
ncbi:type IV pilus secretin PilQ, partial [Myxococcota bacterium]